MLRFLNESAQVDSFTICGGQRVEAMFGHVYKQTVPTRTRECK
jgi:hypothetical protein